MPDDDDDLFPNDGSVIIEERRNLIDGPFAFRNAWSVADRVVMPLILIERAAGWTNEEEEPSYTFAFQIEALQPVLPLATAGVSKIRDEFGTVTTPSEFSKARFSVVYPVPEARGDQWQYLQLWGSLRRTTTIDRGDGSPSITVEATPFVWIANPPQPSAEGGYDPLNPFTWPTFGGVEVSTPARPSCPDPEEAGQGTSAGRSIDIIFTFPQPDVIWWPGGGLSGAGSLTHAPGGIPGGFSWLGNRTHLVMPQTRGQLVI
jgi:hypothetical protein